MRTCVHATSCSPLHFTSLVRIPSLNLRSSVQGSCGKVLCVPGECVPLTIQSALARPSVKGPALHSPNHPKCASAAFSEGTCTKVLRCMCVCVCVCVCAHPKCGLQLRILHFWMVARVPCDVEDEIEDLSSPRGQIFSVEMERTTGTAAPPLGTASAEEGGGLVAPLPFSSA